jgi:ABC-type xylose transport system permease subunit
MKKKHISERREYSLLKPFIYLLLQIILIWEIFWILTGEASLSMWNIVTLTISSILILFLFNKMLKIMNRTPKYNKWTDKIKADKFLR